MIRVALVDDNKSIRNSLLALIQMDSRFRCVCVCKDAEEALVELPKHAPEVVLMDIHLPHMSGIECTAQLKRIIPSVQVIMMTVYEDSERIAASLRAGACGYILKRCSPEEIVAAVCEAHSGGVPMPREVARKVIGIFHQPTVTMTEVEQIPPSERRVLELLTHGLTNKEIASRLGLSNNTVRWYLERIYNRLHVHSRTEAVIKLQAAKSP
jgi:DNA-binding NarL/FixJ family response regulator